MRKIGDGFSRRRGGRVLVGRNFTAHTLRYGACVNRLTRRGDAPWRRSRLAPWPVCVATVCRLRFLINRVALMRRIRVRLARAPNSNDRKKNFQPRHLLVMRTARDTINWSSFFYIFFKAPVICLIPLGFIDREAFSSIF